MYVYISVGLDLKVLLTNINKFLITLR